MIRRLKPIWTCQAIEYTGQSIAALNAAMATILSNEPIVAEIIDGRVCIHHWNCYGATVELGDWIVFDADTQGSWVPDIHTSEAVSKYYQIEEEPA